jgi:predicted lipid-binding transport protein (Tim44 family)
MILRRRFLVVASLLTVSLLAVDMGDAWARARGGGSRGSRSYSAPVRPSPAQPSSPSRSFGQPSPAPATPLQRPSFFSGLMGGIAGFALGGLLGSLLFRGFGGFGSGIGLLDIMLIVGGLGLLFAYLRRRRVETPVPATAGGPAPAYGTAYGAGAAAGSGGGTITMEMPAGQSDLERGIGHIRQMDPAFEPGRVVEFARSAFHGVQAAIQSRDLSLVQGWLTPQMYSELRSQCDQLTAARRSNRVERIDIRSAELSEAWQESGRDWVSVMIAASLLDYVVDDASGAVVEGSRTEPQQVEEFWTFTRPVGNNAWQLSAIQSA